MSAGSHRFVPAVRQVAVPAAMPSVTASTRPNPRDRPTTMPATSESPAPTLLFTLTVGARNRAEPCVERRIAPPAPIDTNSASTGLVATTSSAARSMSASVRSSRPTIAASSRALGLIKNAR